MSGAILALIAHNIIDNGVQQVSGQNSSDRYAHEQIYTEFPAHGLNRAITINRTGDVFSPEYIVIDQSNEEVKLKSVTLEIGGQIILKLDINFMRQLFPDMIRVRNNKVIYQLNIELNQKLYVLYEYHQ